MVASGSTKQTEDGRESAQRINIAPVRYRWSVFAVRDQSFKKRTGWVVDKFNNKRPEALIRW